jgi:hypothetical protein
VFDSFTFRLIIKITTVLLLVLKYEVNTISSCLYVVVNQFILYINMHSIDSIEFVSKIWYLSIVDVID